MYIFIRKQKFSPEEIDSYFRVLEYQIGVMQKKCHIDEVGNVVFSYDSAE